ncbi:hypothetical protein RND71_044174 [Anisodus tanguticus]|uniref:Peptidase S1 domain-containing protein n=1 Tax=Anisodus tanguticus TaxID=243964 RepID=A0AAE1QNN5_9SOLA|nr:hypothetical protein RND71_044174 [Anisodus tanguticus]
MTDDKNSLMIDRLHYKENTKDVKRNQFYRFITINIWISIDVLDRVGDMFKKMIRKRENDGAVYNDLMHLIKETNISKNLGLTENEMVGNGLVGYFAGVNLISDALCSTMFYLIHYPDIKEKLIKEIEKEFSDGIEYEKLVDNSYIDAVLSETLRLVPNTRVFTRTAMVDTEIGGIKIDKGTEVKAISYILNRSEEYFPNPEKFDPNRFLDKSSSNPNIISNATYLPFGDGPKQCIEANESKNLGLTENEIIGNGLTGYFAGVNILSNAICSAVYHLIHNPSEKEKFINEVEKVFSDGIDYEKLVDNLYIDAVINESMRLITFTKVFTRTAVVDTEVDGIKIEKGTEIKAINWIPSFSEEYFPNPKKFDPSRFLDKSSSNPNIINNSTFLPFGDGPKSCIDEKEKLLKEIEKEFSDGIEYEKLVDNPYLDAVISETLRLITNTRAFSRTAMVDTEIDGIKIEKGTEVKAINWIPSNSEEYFPNPKKFDPNRFLDKSLSNPNIINGSTYLPFGDGPKQCIDEKEKLLKEIEKEFSDGIEYEKLVDNPYLDAVISETLRLITNTRIFDRTAMVDTKIGDIKIEKGTLVKAINWIPSNSEEYFPNPKKFDPNRFLDKNSSNLNIINGSTYLPFGDGPKQCVNILSNAICSTVYHLLHNPSEKEKFINEVEKVFSDGIDYEKLVDNLYIDAVINESMRLITFTKVFTRTAVVDTEVDGIKIEKGTEVRAINWIPSNSEEYFPNPKKFDPSRFLDKSSSNPNIINNSTFLPFGDGPKSCIALIASILADDCKCRFKSENRIVNGQVAVENSIPWIVSLANNNYHICGGSIMNEKFILTAAHCIDKKNAKDLTVRVGIHNIQEEIPKDQIYQVKEIHSYEYNGIDEVGDMFKKMYEQRKLNKEIHNDLIDSVKEANEKMNLGFNDNEIIGNSIISYLTGVNPISDALCSVMYQLIKNPNEKQKLIEEIEKEFSDGIEYEKLVDNAYLHAVIKESLRLIVSNRTFTRTAMVDTVIGGIKIEKGTEVKAISWIPNNSEEYFPNPEKFDPNRFLDKSTSNPNIINSSTYLPFGDGPKACIDEKEKLIEKVEKEFSDGIDYEKLLDNAYLDAIIKESLRLSTTTKIFSRTAMVDTEIGGYKIEKGTEVKAISWIPNNSEEYFPNPKKFDPNRFLDKSSSNPNIINGSTYLPFGDGPKACIGKRFSLVFMKYFLVKFFLKYDVYKPKDYVKDSRHSGEANEKDINDGDLCLLDMGCEYYCYGADITCTYPSNGKFTEKQAIIYNAVLKASRTVLESLRPKVSWVDMHILAERVILNDLKNAGLVVGDIDEMIENSRIAEKSNVIELPDVDPEAFLTLLSFQNKVR